MVDVVVFTRLGTVDVVSSGRRGSIYSRVAVPVDVVVFTEVAVDV